MVPEFSKLDIGKLLLAGVLCLVTWHSRDRSRDLVTTINSNCARLSAKIARMGCRSFERSAPIYSYTTWSWFNYCPFKSNRMYMFTFEILIIILLLWYRKSDFLNHIMIINDCKSNTRGIVIHMWAYYPSTHLQMYCWMYYSMQWQMSLSIMHNDARDTVWELEGSTLYSLGTGGEHVMSWFGLETGGEHVMPWYSNTRGIVLHTWAYCPSTHLQMYCWMYYSMQWKMSLSII